MTSPPQHISDHGASMHRLVTPTARIFAAMVILITGTGVSAIFWKMPNSGELHALYHQGVVDAKLAAVPLPSEAVAAITPEEMQRMELPTLEFAPAADDGAGKYAQAYPAPAALAMLNAEREGVSPLVETSLIPVVPQKFEPMRQIVDETPVSIESVNRDFPPKPTSVSTAERSDELISLFHFAKNNGTDFGNADFDRAIEPEQPVNPFPEAAALAPVLQPLQPLPLDNLSPLLPLQESKLQPLAAQIPL